MAKHMIHSLGSSKSFGRLSLKAKVLWPMIISECDDQGRFDAEPCAVKWSICQNVDEITMEEIAGILDEMVGQGMLHLYGDDNQHGQVVNWWPHQPMSYARPSKYPAPEGWADRIHYRKGGDDDRWVNENWEGSGGFDGWAVEEEDEALPNPSDTLEQPLINPSDKVNKGNINKGNSKARQQQGNKPIDSDVSPWFSENLEILIQAGVDEPSASECANYPGINPDYLDRLIGKMGDAAGRGVRLGQGWLVTQIRNRKEA